MDDEPTCLIGNRSMIKATGKEDNIDVLVDLAMSGIEAINSVKAAFSLGMSYELILMDINMP